MQDIGGGVTVLRMGDGALLSCRIANSDDAPALAALSASIQMRPSDMDAFARFMDPDEPGGFARCGGFFEVMDEAGFARVIASGRDRIFLVCEEDGRIAASLWVSLADPGFEGNYDAHGHTAGFAAVLNGDGRLREALSASRVCFARELMASAAAGRHGARLSDLAFNYAFGQMAQAGFTYALSEVYEVVGYMDEVEYRRCRVSNGGGMRAAVGSGGRLGGVNDQRLITLPRAGVSVEILPHIIVFEFAQVMPVLAGYLEQRKVREEPCR
jgi:hypothetical protein